MSTCRMIHRGQDGAVIADDSAEGVTPDLLSRLLAETGTTWVDLDSRGAGGPALLTDPFAFHPLAIEDTRNPDTRVKLDEYDGTLFLVMRSVTLDHGTEDPYDLRTANVYAFLRRGLLVTVHDGPAPALDRVFDRMRRAPDLLALGSERLLHAVLDEVIDAFFPVLDTIDEYVDRLEERVFVAFDAESLHDLFQVKRLVLSLRRHLMPAREVLNLLTNRPSALLTPETQLYFRDIYDHVLRITDILDNDRELLSGAMEAYLTQVSNRLGTTTKALSVVATMSLPFVVVSGMWGMNVAQLPFAGWPYGFWLLLAVQLLLGVLLLSFLRWRRWL